MQRRVVYRTVPIYNDNRAFQDQTERMFRDMQLRMDFPSSQWSSSLVNDSSFFHLNPRTIPIQQVGASERGSREALDDLTTDNLFIEDPQTKSRTFRMSFDVKKYDPKEVQVKVEDRDIIVEAKQTKNGVTSEFNRKIQLPTDVEGDKLTSTLSTDGILTLQAPCPPKYPSVTSGQSPQSSTHVTTHIESSPSASIHHTTTTMASPPQAGRPSPVVISVMPCTPANIPNDTPVFTSIDGGRRRLDLVIDFGRQYEAKDVKVKLDGRKMIVEAIHEEKHQGRVSKSTVQREFDLSEDVDPATVQAMMRPDGQLAIVATSPVKS